MYSSFLPHPARPKTGYHRLTPLPYSRAGGGQPPGRNIPGSVWAGQGRAMPLVCEALVHSPAPGRAGKGRAGTGRAGPGWAGPGGCCRPLVVQEGHRHHVTCTQRDSHIHTYVNIIVLDVICILNCKALALYISYISVLYIIDKALIQAHHLD